MDSNEILKMLKEDGWEVVRIKGSHHQLKHRIKKGTVTVSHPKKDVPIKTLKSILKQAGIS